MRNEPAREATATPRSRLLVVEELTKVYERTAGGRTVEITALDGVGLVVPEASTVAVVGESGGGKSTLARCVALLEEPSGGEITFDGQRYSTLRQREKRALRPRVQLVFQDPATALNPRLAAVDAVAEPLRVQGVRRKRARERARELMDEVGLTAELAEHRTPELSGGQKQRLAIARALAADPRLVVLDEALAGLDLSLQAQIANLLLGLQDRYALTYLFISHDLRMVAHLADDVAVLVDGRLVEQGPPSELLRYPRHEATRALVESAGW